MINVSVPISVMSSEHGDSSMSAAEARLLGGARLGECENVSELLNARSIGKVELNLDVKGQQKSNFGWTALHLASYFGHTAIVELLINNGADVNVVNDKGDTPLHKAAYTGREELVLLLLSANADVFIKNGEGQTAYDVSEIDDIKKLLKGAEETDVRKKSEVLMVAAREGDVDTIKHLLKQDRININCCDSSGNTLLHCAAYRGKKEVAILLLQNGIDPSIKNVRGQLAIDLALNAQMKQILGVPPVKHLQKNVMRFEGPLLRKSRFLGWKEMWAVLDKGVLSFFMSRADASTGSKRKDYKYLDGAEVMVDNTDAATFLIRFSKSLTQKFCVPFVAYQQLDRQKWVNAVTDHVEFSTYYIKQGFVDSDDDNDLTMPLGTMQDKLQTAQAHQQLLEREIELLKPICDNLIIYLNNHNNMNPGELDGIPFNSLPQQLSKLLDLSQRLSSSLSHCLNVFSQQEKLHQMQLKQQEEQIRVWQDAMHALAQEHHELEKSFTSPFHSPPRSPLYPDTDIVEFFDAFEGDYSPPDRHSNIDSNEYSIEDTAQNVVESLFTSFASATSSIPESVRDSPCSKWGRATLPVPMFSRNDFSVWSILKRCIGRELSKISMPVVFNEPLSLLQRITENMEYCKLLELANCHSDPITRMEYVAAFAVASIASNWERLGKPFNPLLGETFEYVRDDMGFRLVSEQVSHHPPISAFHADSPHFIFNGTIYPKLKLWARSVEIKPEGICTVCLLNHNEVYTWSGVNCCVRNIIIGKLWMEQCGTMEVKCHTNGLSTVLNFKPAGWYCRDLNCIEGFLYDSKKSKVKFLFGKWCNYVKSAAIASYEEYLETFKLAKKNSSASSSQDASDSNQIIPEPSLENLQSKLLWEADCRPEFSPDYYSFTSYAMALNELKEDMESYLPCTDSRLRPDIRKLEEGDIDAAASEKNLLEEKQRETRKRMKKEHSVWDPRWFEWKPHHYTEVETWVYKGKYWDRNYENCPDIF